MEKQEHAHAVPNEDRRQTSRQFKGTRLREWGKWVSEIRIPKTREKIYLGSYKTAEQAARAFDAAMYCLKGPNAKFNFPDSVPAISSASSLSPQQIQVAAAKYALNELPSTSTSPSLLNNIDNNCKEEPSQSSLLNNIDNNCKEEPSDNQHMSDDLTFWKSLFERSDDAEHLNLEKIPSMDEAWALEFIPTPQDEEVDISVDPTALWNFQDL
jgi:hypothetical protein